MKKEFFKNKNNLLIIGAIIVAIIIIAVILVCLISKNGKDKNMTTETLENKLEKVGIDFYENFYYSSLEEENKKEQLSSFQESGIKIDITNVQLLVELDQDVQEQFEKDKCDPDETKIIIIPKEPYGQKDYTIKIELSCEK